MAKKPDKWERMVERQTGTDWTYMSAADVCDLLRRQHRAVVRMVRNIKVKSEYPDCEPVRTYNRAVDDILAKLKEMGK